MNNFPGPRTNQTLILFKLVWEHLLIQRVSQTGSPKHHIDQHVKGTFKALTNTLT